MELHFGCDDLAAALENNAIDAAWNLSRAAAEELAEGRSTAYGASGELLLVEFNQRTDDTSGGNALLLDKTVREAVTLCTDRETLALTGFGRCDACLRIFRSLRDGRLCCRGMQRGECRGAS